MIASELRTALCSTFCGDLTVRDVPAGLAISAMFEGADGDRLGCLIERTGGGWRISDDGAFLGDLTGYGVDVRKGSRAEFLARALKPAAARVDPDTLQIVAEMDGEATPGAVLDFLAALSRAQDVSFWTKERVRNTFKEDATRALHNAVGEAADIVRDTAVDQDLKDFIADLVIQPRGSGAGGVTTAVFLVQIIDTLTEALVLAQELKLRHRTDVLVAAMIEDGSVNMGTYKARRAVNRIDIVSYFRDDEQQAAHKVAKGAVPSLRVA